MKYKKILFTSSSPGGKSPNEPLEVMPAESHKTETGTRPGEDSPKKGEIHKNPGMFFKSTVLLFGFSAAVYIVSRFSTEFAEFWVRHFSHPIRFAAAMLSSIFPFSLAETLLLLLPLGLVWGIGFVIGKTKKEDLQSLRKLFYGLITTIMVICILFFTGFGPSYFRKSLAENLRLDDKPVSGESLYSTALWLTEEINETLPSVTFSPGGESHMPYSFGDLALRVNAAFNRYARDKAFIKSFSSPVKMIALSDSMTYTHISGVYSFFTGEANININYPDFIVPYTIAHEMSHQRGIAREDEANFMAFLVCAESDDPYIRYSGYLNVLREVMGALYKADRDLYDDYRKNHYPGALADEISAYSLFFKKYSNSAASKMVSATNHAYLSSQRVKGGVKSYGLVTDLAVAYYETVILNK